MARLRGPLAAMTLALMCGATAAIVEAQGRIQFTNYRVARGTPLATDGVHLFAVADDRQTILRRALGERNWNVHARLGIRPKGLAAFRDGHLVFADGTQHLYRVDRAGQKSRVYTIPHTSLTELAVAGDWIYAFDATAHALHRIRIEDQRAEVVLREIPTDRLSLAATDDGMFAAFPEQPQLLQIMAPSRDASIVASTLEAPRSDLVRRRLTQATSPLWLGAFGQVAYVLGEEARGLSVVAPGTFAELRVHPSSLPMKSVARVLATPDRIFFVNGDLATVDSTPRYVPVEFSVGRGDRPALEGVFIALHDASALTFNLAPWKGSLEHTLEAAGLGYGSPSTDMAALLCTHKAANCGGGEQPVPNQRDDAQFPVPDAALEVIADIERVPLRRLEGRTVGEWLDATLPEQLRDRHGDESVLRKLNSGLDLSLFTTSSIRDISEGAVRVEPTAWQETIPRPSEVALSLPVARYRVQVAVPVDVLRSGAVFRDLNERYPEVRWSVIEGQSATGLAILQDPVTDGTSTAVPSPQPSPSPPMSPPPPPAGADPLQPVRDAQKTLFETLHFAPSSTYNASNVVVGVAEQFIDTSHADFGAGAFISAPAVPSALSRTVKAQFEEGDHGTAVAGVIAATGDGGGVAGLAPGVRIVRLDTEDATLADGVKKAYADAYARIFNLSLNLEEKIPREFRKILLNFDQALFVVAAGNAVPGRSPVCDSSDAVWPSYPVCEGGRRNVIVVAATDVNGIALIPGVGNQKGSTWNEHLVHIAAPGEGFYSQAPNNSYAPVRGTSFAAPLVSATAALLFAQDITNPWHIKQRIIATADYNPNLLQKVWGAGQLNIQRAISWPRKAVLEAGGTRKAVQLDLPEPTLTFTWATGGRLVRLRHVRRLTRVQGTTSFRLIFTDDATDQLVLKVVEPPAAGTGWRVNYRELDAQHRAIGPTQSVDLSQLDDYVGPIL